MQSLYDVDEYLEGLFLWLNITTGIRLEIAQAETGNFNPNTNLLPFILITLVLVVIGLRQDSETSVAVGENVVTANPNSFTGWITLFINWNL